MDPITMMMAGQGIGAIVNIFANMSAADRAAALQDKQFQELIKIAIPNIEDQKLALKQFVQTGKLVPELETAIAQGPSAFEKISEDPRLKDAQMRALQALEQRGTEGLTLQDKADLQNVQMQSAQQEKGAREALMQQFARRGQGGSGMALQAQLAAQQGAADRNATGSLSIAAQARQRALDAIMGAGQLGGQIRGQEYGMAKDKASAQDAIARFNTSNMQDVGQRNVASKNAAQQYNLGLQQDIANKNVGIANQQQMANKSLLQQKYENEMRMAQAKNQIYGGQAQGELNKGQMIGNIGSNVGNALTNYGLMQGMQAQSLQKPIAKKTGINVNQYDSSNEYDPLNQYFQSKYMA